MTAVLAMHLAMAPTTVWKVLTLSDYNTRVVVLGVMALGLACGVVGSLMLLRKRALLGDALSHATLPGIGIAFIIGAQLWGDGKSLPLLLTGAAIAGAIGVVCVLLIRRWTQLKEDVAMGIVLSVFFGAGIALLGVVQQMKSGSSAGLESFIYGKTASMLWREAGAIGVVAMVVVGMTVLLFKEFRILCFDEGFARSRGWPVTVLDVIVMVMVTVVTVVGLSSVGLILLIALLVIPSAAARFWVDRMGAMTVVAGLIGAVGGAAGAAISAVYPNLPSGATIVLAAAAMFLVSLLAGSKRGVIVRLAGSWEVKRRTEQHHVLRALYELQEAGGSETRAAASLESVAKGRRWRRKHAHRLLRRVSKAGLAEQNGETWRLTAAGRREAEHVTRNHRLWEAFLIHHADIAASHVDRDADEVEHVLGAEMVRELERLMQQEGSAVPASPHVIWAGGGGA